jgi:hypothetical protein
MLGGKKQRKGSDEENTNNKVQQPQPAHITGLIISGSGILECGRHDFKTTDVNQWNMHCSDGDHFEEGTTACKHCKKQIHFQRIPFHPYKPDGTKGIELDCNECRTAQYGDAVISDLQVEEKG